MKNTWKHIRQFFSFPAVRSYWTPGDGLAETAVVDLNAQERDYVNLQTHRLLLLKRARQYGQNGRQNWEKYLSTPSCGSAYAVYTAR